VNRTGIFLAIAGVLALVAVVAGLPRGITQGGPVAASPPLLLPATASNGSLTLSTHVSHPFVGLGGSDVFVTADVTGVSMPHAQRAPVNLALVIDRSGSMSGFKLEQAKRAAKALVGQLTSVDRLSIVHYGSDVKSLNGLMATADNQQTLLKYVDTIWDEGGTNIAEGLTTGRSLLMTSMSDFKVNRLILISDGQPTEGLTDAHELAQVVRGIRSDGISVSSIGVGTDFNEELMASFAEIGGGAYASLSDASQLSSIFQKDLNAAATQVARGVTLTFKVPSGTQFEQLLGYTASSRRSEAGSDLISVAMPDFAAGQVERIVMQLRVTGASEGQTLDLVDTRLEYTDLLANRAVASQTTLRAQVTSQEAMVLRNRDKEAMVYSARARAGVNTKNAVEALKQGDRPKAERLMQQNSQYFEEAASAAGIGALSHDRAEQKELLEGLQQATDQAQVNSYSKGALKKARVNYGLIGSTY
jgi:Ca-activated chloride channel family protein